LAIPRTIVFLTPAIKDITRKPMKKKYIGMAFHGKIFVRGGEKDLLPHSQHFVNEAQLGIVVADMFDYRIAEDPVERLVREREIVTRIGDEFLFRMRLLNCGQIHDTQSSVAFAWKPESFHKYILTRDFYLSGHAHIQYIAALAQGIEMFQLVAAGTPHNIDLYFFNETHYISPNMPSLGKAPILRLGMQMDLFSSQDALMNYT
jgi:hypothetical protein